MRTVITLNPKSGEAKRIFSIYGTLEQTHTYCKITTELYRVNDLQQINQDAHSDMKLELIMLSCVFALYYSKEIFLLSSSKL